MMAMEAKLDVTAIQGAGGLKTSFSGELPPVCLHHHKARGIAGENSRATREDNACTSILPIPVPALIVDQRVSLLKNRNENGVQLPGNGDSSSDVSDQSSLFKRKLLSTCYISPVIEEKKKIPFYHTKWLKYTINPHGSFYFKWMGFVSFALLYNAVVIPLRASIVQVQGITFEHTGWWNGSPTVVSLWKLLIWIFIDLLFDVVYLMDIVLVESRVSVPIEKSKRNGRIGNNSKNILTKSDRNYLFRWPFWCDVISVLPFEVFYAIPMIRFNPLLRLPRLLKVRQFLVFLSHFENSTRYPLAFRLTKSYGYMVYLIHVFACIHYGMSYSDGFNGTSDWLYDGKGIGYIRCFHMAFLIVSTIRSQETRSPNTMLEYLIELFGSLVGVFFMAVIISNISNVVVAVNYQKSAMRRKRDQLKIYLQSRKIPKQLQRRIQTWYSYTFTERIWDDKETLSIFPRTMKSDLVVHDIVVTLSKVRIFQGFERCLLRELVQRLKPVLFLPGDYICKKGEIGREMYIVSQGLVLVLGGVDKRSVLATLGPGSIFGEISLLAVGGGNRRTADVVSKGFTNLFILSKKDMYETLSDYPDAQQELKQRARHLLKKDFSRVESHSGITTNNVTAPNNLSVANNDNNAQKMWKNHKTQQENKMEYASSNEMGQVIDQAQESSLVNNRRNRRKIQRSKRVDESELEPTSLNPSSLTVINAWT